MRFAALQGGGAADYARAGKAAANEAANMFAVQRNSSPDYGEIAKTGMKTRSAEKIAGMEAGAQVAKAGINAYTKANITGMSERAKKEVREIGQKSRKAGGIAALGSIAAAGFLAFSDNDEKEAPTNTKEKQAAYKEYQRRRDAKIKEHESSYTEYKPDNAFGDVPTFEANSSSSPTTSGSSKSNSGGASGGKTSNPSDTGSRYMSMLTGAGMSREQAAALTGHMDVESDGFRAHEEYAPNAYGTRGLGHLQWTNAGGSNRRTNFENFASNQGLDPKSFEANSQFLLSEMQGNHGQHWTNGGSYQGFLNTRSLEEASSYLQNNYIRPGVPHTERRLGAARSYFNNFNPNRFS